MKISIINKLEKLYKKFKDIENMLTQPKLIHNQEKFKDLSKEYLRLSNLIKYFLKWKKVNKDIKLTSKLLNDLEMLSIVEEELANFREIKNNLENKIKRLLLPHDPNDKKSCFIEIRAATGGDEAAIFAGDLFRMYGRYAEHCHWSVEVMNCHEGDKGGFKEIIFRVTGLGACGRLKFESGGHRVQRIPQTESQGRVHTSTCTVAVIPEVLQSENFKICFNDLKIDTFRSSGAGGQHVNTTDSAIRITHLPTGMVVECQDERSQHKNKAKALSILSSRIHAYEEDKRNKENAFIRRNLLGSGDRSDRNRTYNFPQNRITDHRINLTLYCLDDVLNGNLDILIEPIIQEYHADFLSQYK
ncbi:peptide chain release factor 1 [Buchnera aphidicola]|uniref:Peptide chain release factor 1 n=1 Tax=Buchnera aphidicola (Stegophylla sp.) TaxID=2315800 RepID=A0A4D6Y8N4_9GAMM|nr:peptide chain release factor 1 [Buchnera aphidicola (Stegophylla sp.)]QCI26306.1 peptide chain release factor 1 [Buchnera aphidicola (Stegophylla sp.)]